MSKDVIPIKDDVCNTLFELVSNLRCPILVVAGPGTGKTTAIACRLKFLIEKILADPERILGITFTNEAADEMKRKLKKMDIEAIPDNIRTLHSFAVRVLRLNPLIAGIPPDFVVANTDECGFISEEVFKDLRNRGYQMPIRSAKKYMRAFQEEVSCGLPKTGKFRNGIISTEPSFSSFRQRYKELLRFYNAVDWFEVVPLANSLLSNNDIQCKVQSLFDHIVVDEYQDLNPAEQLFISLIKRSDASLFVVGDDDQSLYESGRFAEPLGMKYFKERYPDALIDTTALNKSYRCPDKILRGALSLIEQNNPNRIQKMLKAVREGGILHKESGLGSKEKESTWIVNNIARLHNNGFEYNRILILFNIAAIGNYYARVMEESSIPINDRLRKLYGLDSIEKQRLYFLLRLAFNINDGLALRQLFVIEPDLSIQAVEKLRVFAEAHHFTFLEALEQIIGDSQKQKDFKRWLSGLKRIYESVKHLSSINQSISIGEKFEQVIRFLEYNNLEFANDLITLIKQNSDLEAWEILEKFREGKIPKAKPTESEKRDNKVRIMTMHNAKGLDDTDVVFIPALEDSVIPGNYLETEQRRLLYVAITRAREVVFLSNAWSRRGKERFRAGSSKVIDRKPSRFWDEIK